MKAVGAAGVVLGLGPLAGCRSEAGDEIFRSQRKIVDDAGRELTIPTPNALERIYYTSPLAQIYVFSLDPSKQAGTGMRLDEEQLALLPPEMGDLLYMGSIGDGAQIDREMLMQQDVQLVFSISGVELSGLNISDANALQDATGIPVVLVDGSFDRIAQAYRFVGDIMGCEERAEELAVYLEGIYEEVAAAVADIPDEERVRFYYAEGPLGLSTEPTTSQHAKAFLVAGGIDVAEVGEGLPGLGMSQVSLEQVVEWDPEVIISWDEDNRGGAVNLILSSSDWAGIGAVKSGHVFGMPNLPFAWCDRPPGVNRWIGIQWLANLFYPDRYPIDMLARTIEFYSLVYRIELTEDEALEILGDSYPPPAPVHPAS